MFVESTYGVLGSKTRLQSPVVYNLTEGCLMFAVHMFGSNTGNLTVYIQTNSDTYKLYKAIGNHGDSWRELQLNIGHSRWKLGDISILFEATRGDGYRGDMAIDDVTIGPTSCLKGIYNTISSPFLFHISMHFRLIFTLCVSLMIYFAMMMSECSSDEFQCANSQCIPSHLTCDGIDHCGDYTDEYTPCGKKRLLPYAHYIYL